MCPKEAPSSVAIIDNETARSAIPNYIYVSPGRGTRTLGVPFTARPQIRQRTPRLKIRRKKFSIPRRRTGLLAVSTH